MTSQHKTTLHHDCRVFGISNEQVDFEIFAQKRYDEKKKPSRRSGQRGSTNTGNSSESTETSTRDQFFKNN